MNFVGHVEVARWSEEAPAFLFGAMLPDFAGMVGLRHLVAEAPLLAAGIAHHHATDAAFHGAPTFIALCAEGVEALCARGVRRGSARALAHVGTELLLDGLLLDAGPSLGAAYVEAVAWGRGPELSAGLSLAPAEQARLDDLTARLGAWGVPHAYREPAFVAERLEHALRPRPRLALLEPEREAVAPFLRALAPRVAEGAAPLLAELRERLAGAVVG